MLEGNSIIGTSKLAVEKFLYVDGSKKVNKNKNKNKNKMDNNINDSVTQKCRRTLLLLIYNINILF